MTLAFPVTIEMLALAVTVALWAAVAVAFGSVKPPSAEPPGAPPRMASVAFPDERLHRPVRPLAACDERMDAPGAG